ncbi:MAG: hypothetical protein ACT4OL_10150 [Nitrospiraceae bacterium]
MITKTSFSIWYAILTKWATILVHDFIQALNRIEEPPSSRFRTPATTARRRVPLGVAFGDSASMLPCANPPVV